MAITPGLCEPGGIMVSFFYFLSGNEIQIVARINLHYVNCIKTDFYIPARINSPVIKNSVVELFPIHDDQVLLERPTTHH